MKNTAQEDRFYMLVRLWVRRNLTNGDFIDMAKWLDKSNEALHLVFRQLSERDYNRTIAKAFLRAAKRA